ncbi:hypothetical protein [Desulfovibrio litoralis]|uniref:Uncharacterized protein n=1 Tax=Desulfovibrio litoralis DSM 11393 TaxID=1121455 RepID=A0A1M7TGQ7_9BACT|nr:hypothetical protein [Desulfovibrio litoralis]SHN69934.1 hypothetical protein SAMN02745728_01978 [Desulfovibrio litoralis DSM 11393]
MKKQNNLQCIYEVLESCEGEISLYIWDELNNIIFAHTGYEQQNELLITSLIQIHNGTDPQELKGNDLLNGHIPTLLPKTNRHILGHVYTVGESLDSQNPLFSWAKRTRDSYYKTIKVICLNGDLCSYADMGTIGKQLFFPDGKPGYYDCYDGEIVYATTFDEAVAEILDGWYMQGTPFLHPDAYCKGNTSEIIPGLSEKKLKEFTKDWGREIAWEVSAKRVRKIGSIFEKYGIKVPTNAEQPNDS